MLLNKLHREKGLVLNDYKEGTLQRRIERRIKFDGASSLERYIEMIDQDYHLYWRLVSDLFIGVTDFFRDRHIWEIVNRDILHILVARRMVAQLKLPLRIWSAGCSTGEETYSLAMMVKEFYAENNIQGFPAFIYGTDIMQDKLEEAKRGVYPWEKVEKVEESLRSKYFELIVGNASVIARRHKVPTKQSQREIASLTSFARNDSDEIRDTRYEIRKEIRHLTRFKRCDLVQDKKLYGFDMIVCRNVLIYFQRKLQEEVLIKFHKALRPKGILWLGMTETLWGETHELFEPVFKRERIFRKR